MDISKNQAQTSGSIAISVVVLTYNRVAKLSACLDSVIDALQKIGPSEIIVVDDASTDSTPVMLHNRYAGVKVIRHSVPKFPCLSLQEGLDLSRGEFVVRVDDDNILFPDTLQQLQTTLVESPEISFCGATVVSAGLTHPNSGGTQLSRYILRSVPKREGKSQKTPAVRDVDLVDNVYMFRRNHVIAVGGFSFCDLFSWSLEDALPQLALKRRGYRVVCSESARTIHSDQGREINPIQWYYLLRSKVVLLRVLRRASRPRAMISALILGFFHLPRLFTETSRAGPALRTVFEMIRGVRDGIAVSEARILDCNEFLTRRRPVEGIG